MRSSPVDLPPAGLMLWPANADFVVQPGLGVTGRRLQSLSVGRPLSFQHFSGDLDRTQFGRTWYA